ncbi:MAG TPA: FkbM family methyltransferase, partial [Anaerolineales bacterium]|nr:FkbM family methyltransferase [Anaerolineales bacterium]
MTDPEFAHDYDLESVIKIRTKGLGLDFLVTPRFLNHYVKNIYEDASVRLVQQNAKGVAAFIDVGAHYGYFDVVVGRSNPACKILAFEPVPANAEILRRNLALHGISGEVHQAAVSDKPGRHEIQVSEAGDNSGFAATPGVPVLRSIPVDVV